MSFAGIAPSHHRDRDTDRRFRVITDVVTVRASAADMDDAWSLFEVETPPSGGLPAHSQRHDDVGFFVLEGTYTFLVGDQHIELGTGEFITVKRGTVHGYVNAGITPARMLMIVSPGGITEEFFEEIGDVAERPAWQPDMAHVLAVAPKYGIAFIEEAGTD